LDRSGIIAFRRAAGAVAAGDEYLHFSVYINAGLSHDSTAVNASATPLINAEHAAFIQGGVSICVGGCNAANTPSVARALGCRVASGLDKVTVFLAAPQSSALLNDLRANGAIAVVFNQPSTHRSIQLKGRDAVVDAPATDDMRIVEHHREAFVGELRPMGYDPRLIRTLLSCAPEDLVAVHFTPYAAFTQTPGPRAGEPLRENA
jgi:hypothetical protein